MFSHFIFAFNVIATIAFAATGVMAARAKSMDIFGAVILAVVTAVGGGTLRDVLLGNDPVIWVHHPLMFYIAVVTGLVAFPIVRHLRKIRETWFAYLDACGLALFTVVGVKVAYNAEVAAPIAIVMGMITACGGGLIRDVLADRVPYILRREIYATATLAGGVVFYLLPLGPVSYVVCFLTVFIMRMLAIRGKWNLPNFTR